MCEGIFISSGHHFGLVHTALWVCNLLVLNNKIFCGERGIEMTYKLTDNIVVVVFHFDNLFLFIFSLRSILKLLQ